MPSFDSYNAKTTSISYPWPAGVHGVERIALSAQGDLQRVLSAFFARPIVIALVYSQTVRQASLQSAAEPIIHPSPSIIASASPNSPIVQTRQVHLQCAGKIVCTATSTVRITSPECANLFLQEKYAIGQMFRRLEKVPAFELLAVGLGSVDNDKTPFSTKGKESNQLWRKYTLTIPNFECEILEVFPSREMFIQGDSWLTGEYAKAEPSSETLTIMKSVDGGSTFQQGLRIVLGLGFFLLVGFEIAFRYGGHLGFC
ncbi:hypothetical protein BYT27DRAFT_7147702 [Phlegmacium glaucopus]|nr:hypothetical protein BYT27DRAFT_7147702 [Phlegmacium glaucopus]